MREITNLNAETNITHTSDSNYNKTKAEILYDLSLAILMGGRTYSSNEAVIMVADNMYNILVKNGIIKEV